MQENTTDSSVTGTYCERLWTECFIHQDGSVYACCHRQPAILGNVLSDRLDKIFSGVTLRRLRMESLEGRLACYRDCTLARPEKREAAAEFTSLTVPYATLRRLKVLFGEACNLSCIMCHQQHRQRAVLACDSLIANVDLSPFETVEIQGGEPLFIPEAAKYLDYVIALQKRVVILTNGTLIDEAWAEKLARQATVVRISLNAATKHTHELINRGSRWERVMRGIELLRIERDRQQTSLRIRGHMTVVRENLDEIPLFIRQFPAFGFDGINFGFDRSVPLFLRDNPSQKLRLASEIEEALGTCGSHRVSTDRLKLLALVAPSI